VPNSARNVSSEVDELRGRLDALLNNEVELWLALEPRFGASAGDYESTLSWRVTRPLRLLRTFQLSVHDVGWRTSVRLARNYLMRRRRAV